MEQTGDKVSMKKVLSIGYSEVYEGIDAYKKRMEYSSVEKTTGGVSQFIFPSAQDVKDRMETSLSNRDICLYNINKITDIENADYILLSGASEGWISWWKYIEKCGKLNKTIYVADESDAINPYNGRDKLSNLVNKYADCK